MWGLQPWWFLFSLSINIGIKNSLESLKRKISGFSVTDSKTENNPSEKVKYIFPTGIRIVPNLKLQIARFPYKADYTTAFIASGNTMYK